MSSKETYIISIDVESEDAECVIAVIKDTFYQLNVAWTLANKKSCATCYFKANSESIVYENDGDCGDCYRHKNSKKRDNYYQEKKIATEP